MKANFTKLNKKYHAIEGISVQWYYDCGANISLSNIRSRNKIIDAMIYYTKTVVFSLKFIIIS